MKKVERPWRRARKLVKMKRIDILKKTKFPATNSAVKILSKIVPYANWEILWNMIRLFKSDDANVIQTLRHLSKIDTVTTIVLSDNRLRDVVGFNLIKEMQSEKLDFEYTSHQKYRLLTDVIGLESALELNHFRKYDSIEHLQTLHDRYIEILNDTGENNAFRKEIKSFHFPDTGPIPDMKHFQFHIARARDCEELDSWGKRQRNCILTYAGRARSEDFHVYKIFEPEEATLTIRKKSNKWRVDAIAGFGNRGVLDETRTLVHKWMIGDLKSKFPDLSEFPLRKDETEDFHVRPCLNWSKLSDRIDKDGCCTSWRRFLYDEIEECEYPYELVYPEPGYFFLGFSHAQYNVVSSISHNGKKCLSDSALSAIENWLWRKTNSDNYRQMLFNFTGASLK